MKKTLITLIASVSLVASLATTTHAQFTFKAPNGVVIANKNLPDTKIYRINDERAPPRLEREYYLTWEKDFVRIHEVDYEYENDKKTIGRVAEEYYHYADYKDEDDIKYDDYKVEGHPEMDTVYYRLVSEKKTPRTEYQTRRISGNSWPGTSLQVKNAETLRAFIKKIIKRRDDNQFDLDYIPGPRMTVSEFLQDYDKEGNPEPSDTNTSGDTKPATPNPAPAPTPKEQPKELTEVVVKIQNKSKNSIDIYYKDNPKSSTKTNISINASTTRTIRIKVGGEVYSKSGSVLLTVTAKMNNTEQVIAK
jgi:hypothetical protein